MQAQFVRRMQQDGNDMVVVRTHCIYCGKDDEISMFAVYWQKLQDGAHVQHIFPNASADYREQLISGTHGECWDVMMGPEDDDGEMYESLGGSEERTRDE
jgi:hypothetical protein